MTTNVYDFGAEVQASDSRWSINLAADGYIVFADDTGYDKIVRDAQLCMMFAGNLGSIDAWKQWFFAGRVSLPPIHVTHQLSVCVTDMASGAMVYDYGDVFPPRPYKGARFSGTGAPHAVNCWQINKSATKAVQTAIGLDPFTGGAVLHLERKSGSTNISNAVRDLKGVQTAFFERGCVMELGKNKVIPFKDAANQDGLLKDLWKKLEGQGGLAAAAAEICAPFSGMNAEWPEEEKQRLAKALEKYAPQK